MLETESQLLRSQLHSLLCMTLDKGILSLQLRFFVHNVDDGSSHLTVHLSGITVSQGSGGHSTTLDGHVISSTNGQFQHVSAEGRSDSVLSGHVSSTKVSSSVYFF